MQFYFTACKHIGPIMVHLLTPTGECSCSGRDVAQQRPMRHQRRAHRSLTAQRCREAVAHPPASPRRVVCAATAHNGRGAGVDNGTPAAPAEQPPQTRFVAETLLPTGQGKFRLRGYRHTTDGGRTFTEPSAIISGVVEGQEEVIVRVHDACFTSEVLGSLKCDCRDQLALALDVIQAAPPGMVIYLQQEGRGIGLANKIAAYALQEKGLDTVDANRALGLPDDCREYSAVRAILHDLGVKSIRLMTNNPRKIAEISALGITVTERVPCIVKTQQYNRGYLAAKQARMEHILSDEELDGQFCFWEHAGEPGPTGIPLEPVAPLLDADEALAAAEAAAAQQQQHRGGGGGGAL